MRRNELRDQLQELIAIAKENDDLYSAIALQYGLSDSAFWILYALCEAEAPYTPHDLSSYLMLSKQTINSALKSLEKDGCIISTASQIDKRSKYITLTEKGIRLWANIMNMVFEFEESAFSELSLEERNAALEAARKFQAFFKIRVERFLDK